MKVRALKKFDDYKENITREVGDEFEVTQARAKEIKEKLLEFGPGPWIEEIKATPTKKVTKGDTKEG